MKIGNDIGRHLYGEIASWSRFSDTKAGGVIALNALLFGLHAEPLKSILVAGNQNATVTPDWMFIVSLLMGLASVIAALWSMLPKVESRESNSILYFGHIACHEDADGYQSAIEAVSDAGYEKDIAEQIRLISVRSVQKYRSVKWSLVFLGIALVLVALRLISLTLGA